MYPDDENGDVLFAWSDHCNAESGSMVDYDYDLSYGRQQYSYKILLDMAIHEDAGIRSSVDDSISEPPTNNSIIQCRVRMVTADGCDRIF